MTDEHETPQALVQPRHSFFDIVPWTMPSSTDNWVWTPLSTYGNGILWSDETPPDAPTDLQSITYQVGMMAGTWNFTAYYYMNYTQGQFSLTIDGVSSGVIDTYRTAEEINFTRTLTMETVFGDLVIEEPGIKEIVLTKLGTKHQDSVTTDVFFQGLSGVLLP